MAKLEVKYAGGVVPERPKDVTRFIYKTVRYLPKYIRPEPKVKQSLLANRVYWKPTMGRHVVRHPKAVRESADVLAIMKILEDLRTKAEHPARKCGGLTWGDFMRCLKREMKKVVTVEAKLAKLKDLGITLTPEEEAILAK